LTSATSKSSSGSDDSRVKSGPQHEVMFFPITALVICIGIGMY
jgi:hypothetical protein